MRVVALHLFLCVAVLACHSYGQEAGPSTLEAQFREEAPLAWKRLEAKHGQTRFNWTGTWTNNARGKQTVDTESGSSCYRGRDFVIRLKDEETREPEVWGGNDRYLFTVTRSSNDSPWELGRFGPRADDIGRNGDLTHGFMTRLPWCIFETPLRVLTADPSFKIESLVEKSDGSVELRFSVNPGPVHRTPDVTSGRVLFLPKRDWAISAYEAKLTRPTQAKSPPVFISASIVYGPEEDSFVNLVHTTYEFHWQAPEGRRSNKWERDLTCQHCNDPAESFSLASFGLAEPALPSEATATMRPWLWLNIAAIVFLVVAMSLRSRLKAREA